MRLKNVKGAKEIIENSKYIVLNPLEYRGKFQTLFPNDNKIEIEIGMGKGDFIIGKAIQNPNINYIGIEKFLEKLVLIFSQFKIKVISLQR